MNENQIRRNMEALAYSMVELEEKLRKLTGFRYLRNMPESAIQAARQIRMDESARLDRKEWMTRTAEATREGGEDPEVIYYYWEWKNGKPTGNLKEDIWDTTSTTTPSEPSGTGTETAKS